jgi:hypothetical protein
VSPRWLLAALWLEVAAGICGLLVWFEQTPSLAWGLGVVVWSTAVVLAINAALRALAWRTR